MTRLSRSDLEAVLDFAQEAAVLSREPERQDERLLGGVARLIENEMLKYCRVDRAKRQLDGTVLGEQAPPAFRTEELVAAFRAERGPYDVHAARTGQPYFAATRLFDLIPREAFRRTRFHELMWLADAPAVEMRMPAHDDSYWSLELLNPDREFTDRQLSLLDAVRPWLELYEDRRQLASQIAALRAASPAELADAPLTAREQMVLDRVADGASNQDIAEALHISPATVRTHLENIYAKLEVTSRTAALARTGRTTVAHRESPAGSAG
jgi:DNA-binding CsgD family transcriptional regulator